MAYNTGMQRLYPYLPNALTVLRAALALGLFFLRESAFLWIYALCAATDVLDGFLARRWKVQSALGARLDSAADTVLAAALLFRMGPRLWGLAGLPIWVVAIALLRLAAAGVNRRHFGAFAFVHTLLNKATGLALFLYPFALALLDGAWPTYALAALATLSAGEELAIALTASALDRNRRSIFARPRAEENHRPAKGAKDARHDL